MQTTTSSRGSIRTFIGVALVALTIGVNSLIGMMGSASAQDPTLQVTSKRECSGPTSQWASSDSPSYLRGDIGFVAS